MPDIDNFDKKVKKGIITITDVKNADLVLFTRKTFDPIEVEAGNLVETAPVKSAISVSQLQKEIDTLQTALTAKKTNLKDIQTAISTFKKP